MKKIEIKYNPYLVTTKVTIDGQKPKANSFLNVENSRLQEWVEKLPQILIDEYRDTNFDLTFTGTQADYGDVVSAIEAFGNKVNISCKLNRCI